MSELNTSSGSMWFRWSLVALIILAGIGLALVLAPRSEPVVPVEGVTR